MMEKVRWAMVLLRFCVLCNDGLGYIRPGPAVQQQILTAALPALLLFVMNKSSPAPRRILITGFGPFPGQPDNPSARLVRGLAQKLRGEPGLESRCLVLKTEYEHGLARFNAAHRAFRPDITICFGVAARDPAIRLEQRAQNQILTGCADSSGFAPAAAQIDPAGPGALSATLPLDQIAAALKAQDLPVRLSDEAGGYLCNFIFYQLMRQIADSDRAEIGGFVHIPDAGPAPLLHAGLLIVRAAVAGADMTARPEVTRPASPRPQRGLGRD